MLKEPELAMGIQIAERGDDYVVVLNNLFVIRYDDELVQELDQLKRQIASEAELAPVVSEKAEQDRLIAWLDKRPLSAPVKPVPRKTALTVLGFIHLGPIPPLHPAPATPASIYGHLPFAGVASGSERFYRYECYPTSKRIVGDQVAAGTFAAPERDTAYINSGLGAVARYALPSLLPACWRYELTPPAGTLVHYGASVPLYGQSGGGVEVLFPSRFTDTKRNPALKIEPIF
jgi:hypothetical protein